MGPAVPGIGDHQRCVVVVPAGDRTWFHGCLELRREMLLHRGWVEPRAAGVDRYDATSAHLAVVMDGTVVATLRSTSYAPAVGFMLDHEFRALVDDPTTLHHDGRTVEVSRLATLRSRGPHRLDDLLLLFRAWFRLASLTFVERAYCVIDDRLLRHFAPLAVTMHDTMHPLGAPRALRSGEPSQAWCLQIPMALRRLPEIAPTIAATLFG